MCLLNLPFMTRNEKYIQSKVYKMKTRKKNYLKWKYKYSVEFLFVLFMY